MRIEDNDFVSVDGDVRHNFALSPPRIKRMVNSLLGENVWYFHNMSPSLSVGSDIPTVSVQSL